ncbi:hypothetical protein [Hymenobacter convexus]|uniref:hypothetical protein n=1 Tax=Hymenobacter sp. CA1UV-4 TaxID=3063782 RepID=UPI002712D631|nr:hypothetical protein [Hymenobacter sp. CA1UV-4]MDO7852967.1 hypothetical protein [Hymenobacter sp. CA1UV-4]
MTINIFKGEFIIYNEKFDASTSQDSLIKIKQKGKLTLVVDNENWKTFSFVPVDNQPDMNLACNYVFHNQFLKNINVSSRYADPDYSLLKRAFIHLTGLNSLQERITHNGMVVEYFTDFKSSYDYICISFSE